MDIYTRPAWRRSLAQAHPPPTATPRPTALLPAPPSGRPFLQGQCEDTNTLFFAELCIVCG